MVNLKNILSKLETNFVKYGFMDDPITEATKLNGSSQPRHIMENICFISQSKFCKELEQIENGEKFKIDRWSKPDETGGGVTCVLQGKNVIEKGGVNVSVISGKLSPQIRSHMISRIPNFDSFSDRFFACGISSVIHPFNPHSPTTHFNYRYFEIEPNNPDLEPMWWFGGGMDITPNYVHKEDITYFHTKLKEICDKHDHSFYPTFKKWADDYFFIPHREETRGLGGIFFDDLNSKDQVSLLDFVSDCALNVGSCYIPILERTSKLPFTDQENAWKLIRRGRYAEFNLVYDRGTKFGLNVPGSRIESILMSMPPSADWVYCHSPPDGSKEAELLSLTRKPIDWI